MAIPYILDVNEDAEALEKRLRTISMKRFHDFIEAIQKLAVLPTADDYERDSELTHSDTQKRLKDALLEEESFLDWVETEESGFCIITAHCFRKGHNPPKRDSRKNRNEGCDGVFLPRDLEKSMIEISGAGCDVKRIQLSCVVFHEREYKYQHPAISAARTAGDLGRSIVRHLGGIQVEERYLRSLNESNFFRASLSLMCQVMRQFREVFPKTYVYISMRYTRPRYPWHEEYAVFLHVLSQAARLELYMPERLKVVMAASGAFMRNVWDDFKEMGIEEVNSRQEYMDELVAENVRPMCFGKGTLQFHWWEGKKKGSKDKKGGKLETILTTCDYDSEREWEPPVELEI